MNIKLNHNGLLVSTHYSLEITWKVSRKCSRLYWIYYRKFTFEQTFRLRGTQIWWISEWWRDQIVDHFTDLYTSHEIIPASACYPKFVTVELLLCSNLSLVSMLLAIKLRCRFCFAFIWKRRFAYSVKAAYQLHSYWCFPPRLDATISVADLSILPRVGSAEDNTHLRRFNYEPCFS